MTEKLEPGDWVARASISIMCYEVRSIDGGYVRLSSLHLATKQRFNCSSPIGDLMLIRKKDGRVISPPTRCER